MRETLTLGRTLFFKLGLESVIFLVKSFQRSLEKTAKKLAAKAAGKGVEKIGEKTGQLIGEKIYDKFSAKSRPPETKGAEIMAILQEPKKIDEFQYVKDVYNDLL